MSEPAVKLSQVILDGVASKIPYLDSAAPTLDKLIALLKVQSGVLDFFDGTAANGSEVIPFDYTVLGAFLLVTEQLGTGASLLNIGTSADTDKYVDDFSVTTAHTAGTLLTTTVTLTATLTGSAGDVIQFTSGNGATTTGKGIAGLLIVPR